MNYKQLYIFVEGDDDKRFFISQINPLFKRQYNFIKYIQYARLESSKVEKFITTIRKQKESSDYIFISDFDGRKNPKICISKRKTDKLKIYKSLEENRISIVKEEIEGWYFAGISNINIQKFKLKTINNTEQINKDFFEMQIPKEFQYKNDFLIEILKDYSIISAKEKNKSFIDKYVNV